MATTTMALRNSSLAKTGSSESPSPSLYLTNLTDRLRKPDMRLSLYTIFSTYGPVLDVVVMPGVKMRGQAHVVFRDAQTSTQAMRALQGFDFFGKDMKIQYATGRSGIFQKLEGIWRSPNATTDPVATNARQSLFSAPVAGTTAPPAGLPPKPVMTSTNDTKAIEDGPQGVKRRREEESDNEEAPMEEDEDEDVPMEASSDEE